MERGSIRKANVLSPMDQCEHAVTTRVLSPELDEQDPVIGEALELAQIAAVSRNACWARDRGVGVLQNYALAKDAPHSYVIDGPYPVKRYLSEKDALIQAATLNTLHGVLAERGSRVHTARVLALASDGCSPPAGVLERAPGVSLRQQYQPEVLPYGDRGEWHDAMMAELRGVQEELDDILGHAMSRLLVNDIMRFSNAGANVFGHDINGERHITLIDQPCVGLMSGLWHAATLGLAVRHRGWAEALDSLRRVC